MCLFYYSCIAIAFVSLRGQAFSSCSGSPALRCGAQASRRSGFCCKARAPGAQAATTVSVRARWPWGPSLVAPWPVGSSQIGDRNHNLCIGRWVLTHCTIREVLSLFI